jgi:hypothetical protein
MNKVHNEYLLVTLFLFCERITMTILILSLVVLGYVYMLMMYTIIKSRRSKNTRRPKNSISKNETESRRFQASGGPAVGQGFHWVLPTSGLDPAISMSFDVLADELQRFEHKHNTNTSPLKNPWVDLGLPN